jgi:hypothetical protein
MRTSRARLFLGALLSALLMAPSAFAEAAHCDLTAIEGSKEGSGVDKELAGIKELSEPPFSTTYSRFSLLGKAGADLEVGVEKELSLTKAQVAKLTYGGEDPKDKIKLQLRVKLPALSFNTDVKMKNGGHFIAATKSGFILFIKCEKK